MDWDPVIVRGKIDKTREKEKYVKFMGQEIKLPKRSQYSGISPEQKLEEAELCGTHRKVSKETGLTIQRARVAKCQAITVCLRSFARLPVVSYHSY